MAWSEEGLTAGTHWSEVSMELGKQMTTTLTSVSVAVMLGVSVLGGMAETPMPETSVAKNEAMKTIYLAGGCFWGVEHYMARIPGVVSTEVGYANGTNGNDVAPSYEEVCHNNTGHAETVRVEYDPAVVSLPFLLRQYFQIIDPLSVNRQGGDVGTQYRTGIYYSDAADAPVVAEALKALEARLGEKSAVEVEGLRQFFPAEEYHQDYLDKNPQGYCHISPAVMSQAARAGDSATHRFEKPTDAELREKLSAEQYAVTQEAATEAPFQNEYYATKEPGIYVDITTGEPLFLSSDKFDSGCGWPSFSRPIREDLLSEIQDLSHGMVRTEVRSALGNAHLGHVFEDGPKERGGLRYCINSASLRFVPLSAMANEGYSDYIPMVEAEKKQR
jgi:peptide methionine sulfoxide reductase msrA/msrB